MPSTFSESVLEIEQKLREVAGIVRRKGRLSLENHGITPPQFDALLILDRIGSLTIGELGNRLFLAYSTTTDLVDRLERAVFVERERDQSDRRVVRVNLLPSGARIIEDVLDARRTYIEETLSSLNSQARQDVLSALSLLHAKMVEL